MKLTIRATLIALAAGVAVGCATLDSPQERELLVKQASVSRQAWANVDPSIEGLMKKAHGFAFFPEVGSAGFIVAGSHGHGVVYEQGRQIGFAELTGGSLGFTVGGQTASELVVFENQAAMDRFRKGEKMNFGANANAVIAKAGAAANASFVNGVAVFVRPLTGVMAEASLGGQEIRFIPK
jgi:lipid-binding SYLF domain-containing protein